MKTQDCKTQKQICKLQNDNYSLSDFWCCLDGKDIAIVEQKNGEPATQGIQIPRAKFNRLIAWYQKDQKERKEK